MSLIKSINFQNFKQFENYIVSCKSINILTGPNNAGKSTVLDSLRIVSDVIRYSNRRKPERATLDGVGVCASYVMPHSSISIPIENISRNYSDSPATIKVTTADGVSLTVKLHPDHQVEVFLDAGGKIPVNGVGFRKILGLDLCIVPTLGPFEDREEVLTDATVEANMNTRRAARNFRNIVYRMGAESFEEFAGLVSETWPDVKILFPERNRSSLAMMYEESRIPREINWSGFGLQMWLQMLLQFMRGDEDSIFILDEPDIYLHADLQRKLLKMSQNKFGQLFLATHSTEIINDASPGDVLMVKKGSRGAKRVTDEKAYRELFQYLGSSENAEFARVARANRIVFFEGDDKKLLRRFAKKLSVGKFVEDTDTVILKAGGFGQWKRVTHTKWALSELFDMKVAMAALFDRDYRCDAEVESFVSEMSDREICCRVLKRKEIENYCLSEASVIRLILKKSTAKGFSLSEDEAKQILFEVTGDMEVDTHSNRTGQRTTFVRSGRGGEADAEIAKIDMLEFRDRWKTLDGRFKLVSGKQFIGNLSRVLQDRYGISVTSYGLIDEIKEAEVDPDLKSILTAFDLALSS